MKCNKDYITVSSTKPTDIIDPYLHSVELTASRINPDESHLEKQVTTEVEDVVESYMMLPGGLIRFDDFIDIQVDLVSLKFFELPEDLRKVDLSKKCSRFIIDISGNTNSNAHQNKYPEKFPDKIRPVTYGSIRCEDFYNLAIKKDFSYGLCVDIPSYGRSAISISDPILQNLPWPINKIQLHDKKLKITAKIPDLDFIPSPHYVLKLIVDFYKEASSYLSAYGYDSFDLKLLDLNNEN